VLSKCRLCGGRDLKLYYSQGNNDQFRFYRCLRCKLVNYDLSSGLNQEKYAEAYVDPRQDDHRHNIRQTGTYRFLRKHLDTPGRVLDVGCGNGRLLFLARQDGWTVRGLELSGFLAESTERTVDIDVDVGDLLEYRTTEKFGLVILRHVLEHIPDPIRAMNRINALLKIGGHSILEFPNIVALGFRIKRSLERMGLRKKRYPENYRPGHCNEFCRESFTFLLAKTGFRLETWHTYSSNPLFSPIHRALNTGSKARALIRKVDEA